jgi:hypothetical protein
LTRCEICGGWLEWPYHDHRPDGSGLDDGPPLRTERKKAQPKAAAELRDIRARAWATRRAKYGPHGHRP